MFEDVLGGLCVCWLLPLSLLGGVVLVSNAIGVAWRNRGLERGAVYCSGCRFNLQGCGSWNCPECGAHLDEGRVMTVGHDRPLPLFPRVLLVAGATVGPLVLVGVLLAHVAPVNHRTDRVFRLTPVFSTNAIQLAIDSKDERAWYGRGTPVSLDVYAPAWSPRRLSERINEKYETPLPNASNELLPPVLWGRVEDRFVLQNESEVWRDAARGELVAVLRYAANEGGRPDLMHFRMTEQVYSRFEPSEWFVLVDVSLALLVWFFVIRWTVRWHGRVVSVYLERHGRLAVKVNEWIGRNRERAGLGDVLSSMSDVRAEGIESPDMSGGDPGV